MKKASKKVSKKVSKKPVVKPLEIIDERIRVKVSKDGSKFRISEAGKEVEMLLSEIMKVDNAEKGSIEAQEILKKYYLN